MKFHKLNILLLMMLLQSCMFYNSTKHAKNNTCEIHQQKMHKALVLVTYGKSSRNYIQPGHQNAKSYIHMGCVIRFPRKYFGLKYYCKECQRLKRRAIKHLKENGDF